MISILSFGGGVQSVAIAAMCALGKYRMPTHIIFSDPQWESEATYSYMDWFDAWMKDKCGVGITRVTRGSIRNDTLNAELKRCAQMPFWTRDRVLFGRDGKPKKGLLPRQCTDEYKITVVRNTLRRLYGVEKGKRWGTRGQVEMWLGISTDEAHRMKPSRIKYITNVYPLIDMDVSRDGCGAWLAQNGIPVPPKSSCIGCPFHSNEEWLDMKNNRPKEWLDAVEFDEAIRHMAHRRILSDCFLHKDGVPLKDADLTKTIKRGFGNECRGFCGN